MEQTFHYIVEFDNGYSARVIGETIDYKECAEFISKFLDEHNYKSHYWRYWATDNGKKLIVDVGSHTQFFYISRSDGEDMTFAL